MAAMRSQVPVRSAQPLAAAPSVPALPSGPASAVAAPASGGAGASGEVTPAAASGARASPPTAVSGMAASVADELLPQPAARRRNRETGRLKLTPQSYHPPRQRSSIDFATDETKSPGISMSEGC